MNHETQKIHETPPHPNNRTQINADLKGFFVCFYYSTTQQLNHLTDSENSPDS